MLIGGLSVAVAACGAPRPRPRRPPVATARTRFLTSLGFSLPADLAALAGTSDTAKISEERLDLLDRDLLVWNAGFSPELRGVLGGNPLYQQLAVVRDKRVLFLEDANASGALTWSTVLSLPYAIDAVTRSSPPPSRATATVEWAGGRPRPPHRRRAARAAGPRHPLRRRPRRLDGVLPRRRGPPAPLHRRGLRRVRHRRHPFRALRTAARRVVDGRPGAARPGGRGRAGRRGRGRGGRPAARARRGAAGRARRPAVGTPDPARRRPGRVRRRVRAGDPAGARPGGGHAGRQARADHRRDHGVRRARLQRSALRGEDTAPADLLGPDTVGTIKIKALLDETVVPQDTAPRPVELNPDSAAARAVEDSIRRAAPATVTGDTVPQPADLP